MPLLIIAFVLSGAAGLIYESIWSRYLGLFVGHSAYAQIIVLVIFLGGMSIGAWLAGERSARLRYPLRAYAIVELLAGLLGLAFHGLFSGATAVAYDQLFPALAGGAGLAAAKWTIAGLLILPQSILLGTTFPLMTAGALRLAPAEPGRTLSLMYFANSLGAAVGVLLAGFVLIAWGGLQGTLETAAVLNFVVAAAVYGGSRVFGWEDRPATVAPADAVPAVRADAADFGADAPSAARNDSQRDARVAPVRLLLAVAFGTAVASFTYEIAWIRMLSLVLGSATHSFELMLSTFILGLALGALLVRRHADRFASPVLALGVVQVAMGSLAIATLPVYMWTFDWISALMGAVNATDGGYRLFAIARYALCVLVMFPATICAGMTLPLITRTLFVSGSGERAIGRVYSINTLGSIIGVGLAGLLLMPLLGVKWLLVTGALLDVVIGVTLLAWLWDRDAANLPDWATGAMLATAAFLFAVVTMTPLDRTILTSGVFRRGQLPEAGAHVMRFYRDGRTATVSVKQVTEGGSLVLSTNGKPDASMSPLWLAPADTAAPRMMLDSDMGTQVLLALSTLAHAPGARVAAVIGQGSGVTSHFMLASPSLTHLSTIEIEPEIIEASRHFLPFNARAFEDPRATFVVDDAKSYFASGGRTYDVILSEPSNPWVSGVSGLFTDEFYRRVRTHLSPDGVFGQWLHLYEIDDDLVLSVLAAIDRNFEDYAIYGTAGMDILVVAKPRGRLPAPAWETVTGWPAVRQDLARALPLTAESLERSLVITREVLRPMLAARDRPNSDFYPVLDLGAEKARFLKRSAAGIVSIGRSRFDLPRALTGQPLPFATGHEAGLAWTRSVNATRAARLRSARNGEASAVADDEAFERAQFSMATVAAMSASLAPPDSWRGWFEQVAAAEEVLHLGTAGVADEAFWAPVMAYAARHAAPPEVQASLDLLYGAGKWDWPRVLRAEEVLTAAQQANRGWVNAEMLRDVVVTAHLREGDPAGARRALERLTVRSRSTDPAYNFRTQLLFWYVAERAGQLVPEAGER